MQLIFTDLDGTLLDHHTYSFAAASDALAQIKSKDIPLIIVTSKTAAEVIVLQKDLGICEPFVVENGGGVYIPEGYGLPIPEGAKQFEGYLEIVLGADYSAVRSFGEIIKERFGVSLFSDLPVEKLSKLIGLSPENAMKSLNRRFSEPFYFEKEDGQVQAIMELAAEKSLKILRGGRFYHIVGEHQDKGRAVNFIISLYSKMLGSNLTSVGFGDSGNDIEMLEAVDVPVMVKKHTGLHEVADIEGIIYSSGIGPVGWNSTVLQMVSKA